MSYQESRLFGIADAIRGKGGSPERMQASAFAASILGLPVGIQTSATPYPVNPGNQQEFLLQIANAIRAKENSADTIPATDFAERISLLQPLSTYTVSASLNMEGAGTISGTGVYSSGATATLTIALNSGYTFSGWELNGVIVGTGASYSFTVEDDVVLSAICKAKILPDGYTELEYVEVPAGDKHCVISCGLTVTFGTGTTNKFKLAAELPTFTGASNQYLFGAPSATTSNGTVYNIVRQVEAGAISYRLGRGASAKSISADFENQKSEIEFYTDFSKKATINGIQYTLTTASGTSASLYLFGSGTSTSGSISRDGKYYRFTVEHATNGVVLDFIPARRDSDGVIGFYDIVRSGFYAPANDPLTAGPAA